MKSHSGVISGDRRQLTLQFELGAAERFRNLRESVAQGVYRRGLKRVAGDLDMAPGNLSAALADDSNRKVGLDEFEAYLAKTGDMQPIYYLIEKFLGDPGANEDSLREQALQTLASLPDLIAAAGLAKKGGRR